MIAVRQCFLLLSLACAGLIATALYMQYAMGLEPCYLCIVQRVFVVVTGAVALLAFIHNPGLAGTRVYAGLTAVSAFAGAGFSTRQVWLQSLPADQVPACGPPADYLFSSFSFAEWLPILLRGDGNCAKVDWTFLGLSIAGWMLIIFVAMAFLALWQALRRQ